MILKTHIHLFIITHEILQNLKDKNILQTFIDSTYRCAPQAFRNYKFLVMAGFALLIKLDTSCFNFN